MHLVVVEAASRDAPPPLLDSAAHIRVQSRLDTTAEVYFGITLRHSNGGFAGKHIAVRKVKVPAGGQAFDRIVPLAAFKPLEKSSPATPAGLELVDCWCLTAQEDRGLLIGSVELQVEK